MFGLSHGGCGGGRVEELIDHRDKPISALHQSGVGRARNDGQTRQGQTVNVAGDATTEEVVELDRVFETDDVVVSQ